MRPKLFYLKYNRKWWTSLGRSEPIFFKCITSSFRFVQMTHIISSGCIKFCLHQSIFICCCFIIVNLLCAPFFDYLEYKKPCVLLSKLWAIAITKSKMCIYASVHRGRCYLWQQILKLNKTEWEPEEDAKELKTNTFVIECDVNMESQTQSTLKKGPLQRTAKGEKRNIWNND